MRRYLRSAQLLLFFCCLLVPLASAAFHPFKPAAVSKSNQITPQEIRKSPPGSGSRILVLHSYHKGLQWSDGIQNGIDKALQGSGLDIEVYVEYLDSIRFSDEEHKAKFLSSLGLRYQDKDIDSIIVVDNNAFQFLLDNRSDIFPLTPIVFCGINHLDPAILEDHQEITGVVENPSFSETFDLIVQLNPNVNNILVLGDSSLTYLANQKNLKEQLSSHNFDKQIIIQYFEDPEIGLIVEKVRSLPANSAAFLMGRPVGQDGKLLSNESLQNQLVTANPAVPIFGAWDFQLGAGILGGKLISSQAQGKAAAELAVRLIKGESASDIPIKWESPNLYQFDFAQLDRMKISLGDLPSESTFINQPFTSTPFFKDLIWIGGVVVAVLVLIILALSINTALRRKAQKALLESEQRYRNLFETMHQGVLFMDSRGRITTVNPAAEIILGNEKEQLQGVQFKDLWENLRETNLPDSYEDLPPIIVQKTGRPAADLVCFLHQDSKRRQWVLMSSLPQFLEDSSSPSGIHTTITNITDLMNTSEALRHSEDQYRRLVESINDWIVEVDNDGTYTFVGPQVKDILGFSPQEVEGKHFTQFMPEDEAKRMSEIYLHHVEKQEPFNGIENVMLHRNGKLVIIETNGSPFFKDGELKGYRGINRDISYRREADELVQKANWELSRAYEATLEGWSDALILREQETAGHSQRVTSLTMKLARKVGVPEVEMPHIRRGALLHDIGKIGVPDSILKKEGQLLDEEWDVMRLHPVYAYQLLSPIKYLRPAMEIPYCHHEHWDGSGYPRGLKREGIPLSARIFSIVDVWDALTSSRPYSPAWSEDDAIRYIKEKSGTQFDPKLVEPFIELIAEINLSRQDTIPQKKDERIDQYLGE